MSRVLVVANETIGGRSLLEKAAELKEADPDLQVVGNPYEYGVPGAVHGVFKERVEQPAGVSHA